MREPAQARLDAAEDDGRLLVRAADQVAVHHRRMVRSLARLPARRIRIALALLLGNRIVVHHGVHVARRNEEPEARLAEHGYAPLVGPVGLRDEADPVAVGLEQPRDDGAAERGMIDVRIARHVHEIDRVPSAIEHIAVAYR